MAWSKLARACLGCALWPPGIASALVVEIQGIRLEPAMVGASCVDIAGVYPGVRIEADKPGQTPRVCHNAARVNAINIANATLIAMPPAKKDIAIRFEHEFPPGVNGKIMARAKLQGFFATGNGVGIPSGDKLSLNAFFSQGATNDLIAEPLSFSVGDQLESALFDYSVKKQYLAAGPRTLKGVLKITFASPGHKVTFPDKCLISLDTGATFDDKLDTMEIVDEAPPASEEGLGAGNSGEVSPVPGTEGINPAPRLEPQGPAAARPEASAAPSAGPAGTLPPLPNPPPAGR
jgi:hypothetical protein